MQVNRILWLDKTRAVTLENIFSITKACLCNFDPFKPHVYTVQQGFKGVYIIIFLSLPKKHRLWVLVTLENILSLTKTCQCNFDPLKPHFCIVQQGFKRVYIIFFLISAQKHRFLLTSYFFSKT